MDLRVSVRWDIPVFKNGLIIPVCDFMLFSPILKTLRTISNIVSVSKGKTHNLRNTLLNSFQYIARKQAFF